MSEREPLRIIAVTFDGGVWVRIQGPLSGAWYGPWRLCANAAWAERGPSPSVRTPK